MGYLPRTSFD
jgi:hypothetical protein